MAESEAQEEAAEMAPREEAAGTQAGAAVPEAVEAQGGAAAPEAAEVPAEKAVPAEAVRREAAVPAVPKAARSPEIRP